MNLCADTEGMIGVLTTKVNADVAQAAGSQKLGLVCPVSAAIIRQGG